MPNKGLYIPPTDVPLWEAVERVAKKHGTSVYRVVSDALKNDLSRADAEGPVKPADHWAAIAADAA